MSEQEQEPQEPVVEPETPEEDEHDESEHDEQEDEPASTPEDAPQPAQHGLTPEGLEKRARSAEKRFETYERGILGLYEEEAERLVRCPLCPDQHKGLVHLDHAGLVPQDIADAVKMYLGIAREQNYEPSHTHRTCEECEGKGKVATGSQVPGHETILCPDCGGRGYVGPPAPAAAPLTAVTGPSVLGLEVEPTQAREDVDEWGEPRILPDGRENPNFGRMPNRKILVEPWGQTAGLNALSA